MVLENYGRGMRMEHKRRGAPRNEPPPVVEKPIPTPAQPTAAAAAATATAVAAAATTTAAVAATAPARLDPEADDKPIPDDLSEISDDPDDILNREDVSNVRYYLRSALPMCTHKVPNFS